MRVLSVVHGAEVGPGLLGDEIRAAGHELSEWQIARDDPPSTLPDAVLVLGGPMNVGEEADHPWLEREYAYERSWVERGTPLLGICLGAQTLAHAFGARVARLPERQAGLRGLVLSDAGRADPVLGVLPARGDALVANAFGFDVPPGAVELAASAAGPQAFRLGERAWGVQFHPEARRAQVLAWWGEETDLPRPLPVLERELAAGIEAWHALGRALCRAFLAVAQAS